MQPSCVKENQSRRVADVVKTDSNQKPLQLRKRELRRDGLNPDSGVDKQGAGRGQRVENR